MLLVQVVMVRALSRDAFGAFAFAQAFVLLFETVFVPRSAEIALQLIGKAWHQQPGKVGFLAMRLRREELRWNLGICASLSLLAVAAAVGLKVDVILSIALGLAIPLQSGYGVSKAVIVAAHRIRAQSLFEIAVYLTTLLVVGFGVWGLGLAGAVTGYVVVAALKTMWAHGWANRLIYASCPVDPATEEEVSRQVFHRLSMIAVWRNGCLAAANQADVLMVGSVLGNEAVALYRAAKTLAGVPARIVAPIWGAMRPRLLAVLSTDDRQRLPRLIAVPGMVLLLAGVLSYPLLASQGSRLIDWMFTEAYRDAVKPMLILSIGSWLFSAVTGWLGFLAIIVERKQATTLLFTLNAGIVLVAGALVRRDIASMALVVCTASVVTSAVAWWWLISTFLMRGRSGTSGSER